MKKLIEDWKQSADKYEKLGRKADHNPTKQEGWLCRSEVYNYCASKLEEFLQQKDDRYDPVCRRCGDPLTTDELICLNCKNV